MEWENQLKLETFRLLAQQYYLLGHPIGYLKQKDHQKVGAFLCIPLSGGLSVKSMFYCFSFVFPE